MRMFAAMLIGALTFAMCGSRTTEDGKPEINSDGSWDIVLKGKITNPEKGKIYITEMRPDRAGWKDSIDLKSDNTYEKKIHLSEAGYFAMNFYNRQMFNIILYKNNVTINIDLNSPEGKAEIIGSPENDVVMKVQSMVIEAQTGPEVIKLKEDFAKAASANDEAKVKELQEKYLEVTKKSMDEIAAYLIKQPASLAQVELLGQGSLLSKDEYGNVYEIVGEKLKKEMPNSVFVKPFLDEIEKSRSTAIGSVAPEITMPDPTGRIIKLSSLRGKYVLVDFWAKWCGPCRRENPTVVKAYAKFKAKGFEVFGVSLDRDKADWIQAIREDGLTWTQVSDLRYFESRAARDYSINAIPFSILLDPKGVIVAKNLRGVALEKKLTELLGN